MNVRKTIQPEDLAWRNVDGDIKYRPTYICKNLKENALGVCVIRACIYGLEVVAQSGAQQQHIQVCEHNWMRKIIWVKRADRRRLDDICEKFGMNVSIA